MTLLSHTELLELDAQYCWHPFTQMQTATAPLAVVRGQNEFLFDAQGKKYFDAVSSWWVNIHGHSHPAIAQAIARQAAELEHVMFAGVTHPPAAPDAEALYAELLRLVAAMGMRNRCSVGIDSIIGIGRPRVSGPNNSTSSLAKLSSV